MQFLAVINVRVICPIIANYIGCEQVSGDVRWVSVLANADQRYLLIYSSVMIGCLIAWTATHTDMPHPAIIAPFQHHLVIKKF